MEKVLKTIIGRNKTLFELFFLFIYFIIQLILVIILDNPVVSVLIIAFLFFLALERIFMKLGNDGETELERRDLERKEEELKIIFNETKSSYDEEIARLNEKIHSLEKENIILQHKR